MSSNSYADRVKELQGNPVKGDDGLHGILDSQVKAAQGSLEAAKSMPDRAGFAANLQESLKDAQELQSRGIPAGMQSVLNGFLKAASGNKKKTEELERIGQVFKSIEDTGARAAQDLQRIRSLKQAWEDITPSLTNYIKNATNIAPRDRMDALEGIVNRFNRSTGQDWKVMSIDGHDPTKVLLSSPTHGNVPMSLLESPLFKGLRDEMELQKLKKQADDFSNQQIANETTSANAQATSASANLKRANLDADLHDLNKDKLRADIDKIKAGDGKPDYDQMETQAYLRLHALLSDNKNDPTNPTGIVGRGTQMLGSQLPVVGDWLGSGLAQKQEYNQILSDLKGFRFKKFGYSNKSEFDHIDTLGENVPRNEALKFVENELSKKGINPNIKTITLKKNGKTKSFPTQNYAEAKKLAEDTGYEVVQ